MMKKVERKIMRMRKRHCEKGKMPKKCKMRN